MAQYVGIRNGGATDEQGAVRLWKKISSNGQGVLVSGDLAVTPHGTPNNSVDIQVGDIAISYQGYLFHGWSDSIVNKTISDNSSGNPRKDSVVAYIDLAVVSSASNNNPNALKFMVVAGTPAGSPVVPSGATIQAAVGAGNPYYVLRNVNVPNGFTSSSTVTNSGSTVIENVTSQFIVGSTAKLLFYAPGVQAVQNDISIDIPGMPQAQTFTTIEAYAKTAPVGAGLSLRVYNVTQGHDVGTVTIADGSNQASTTSLTNAGVNQGDVLRLDCTVIGSTTPGSNATVLVY